MKSDLCPRRRWGWLVPAALAVCFWLYQSDKLNKTQNAIRDERLRAEMIIASTPNAVVMCGPDQNITYANPAAEKLFGWSHDELIGKNTSMLIPPEYREAHVKAIRAAVQRAKKMQGNWVIRKEMRGKGLARDGSTMSINFSMRTIGYNGKVEFIASMTPWGLSKQEAIELPDLEKRIEEYQERAMR